MYSMSLKHMAALASLSAATLLPGNLNAQPAPVPFTEQNTATPDKQEILSIARKVADWQIKEFSNNKYAVKEPKGWIAGALYMGMFDWAELSGDNQYFDWLKKVFNRQHWQVADRMYHADDVCVSQTYIDMYTKYKEDKMLLPTTARIDWVINNRPMAVWISTIANRFPTKDGHGAMPYLWLRLSIPGCTHLPETKNT
jgi:unsaturated rhamnogalacturonyl hydrolase